MKEYEEVEIAVFEVGNYDVITVSDPVTQEQDF